MSDLPQPTVAFATIPVTNPCDCASSQRALNELEEMIKSRTEIVDELKGTLASTQADIQSIKTQLNQNSGDTREVLDILHAGKGFFKVVGWIGGVIKWVTIVGAPVLTFLYTIKGGGK